MTDLVLEYCGEIVRDRVSKGSQKRSARVERYEQLKGLLAEKGIELIYDDSPENVRRIMETAGNKIGSVQFIKRSSGELRKMTYRLHVKNPTVAKAPKGTAEQVEICTCGKERGTSFGQCMTGPFKWVDKDSGKVESNRKDVDKANDQMTVFDTNKVVRGRDGAIIGRGAWRTVPLENVTRIAANGKTYIFLPQE